MRWMLLPLSALLLTSCEDVGGAAAALGIKAPSALLDRVDLVDSPTLNQVLAWSCFEYIGATACQVAGYDSQPSDSKMTFSFDIVFDLTNENENIPIPLIETLLGVTVYDATNLGSICVSYCDPEAEDCTPSINAEGACEIDDNTTEVDEPSDLVPTVDDLIALASDVVAGDFDNGSFRVVQPGETLETHLQFDLAPASMMQLGEQMLTDAVTDALAGKNVKIEVPYTMEGTLFFDVPDMGRYAIGYGPWADVWPVK